MDIETFREFCLSLPGTTEGMKWDHLCFMVAEKLFVIVDIDAGNSFSIKCRPEDFDELTARRGIRQAPHMAKKQWVLVESPEVFGDEELKERIATSRALVLAKLPRRVQAQYA